LLDLLMDRHSHSALPVTLQSPPVLSADFSVSYPTCNLSWLQATQQAVDAHGDSLS